MYVIERDDGELEKVGVSAFKAFCDHRLALQRLSLEARSDKQQQRQYTMSMLPCKAQHSHLSQLKLALTPLPEASPRVALPSPLDGLRRYGDVFVMLHISGCTARAKDWHCLLSLAVSSLPVCARTECSMMSFSA